MSSTLAFFRFAPQEVPGAIVVNAFAILSTIALLTVAFRGLWLVVVRLFLHSDFQSRESLFFNTVLGNYAASLLLANFISSVAGLMGLNQLFDGGIQEGTFCTAQAIVMQVANFAGAYFTLAIGLHTFLSLVVVYRQTVWICVASIFVGWSAAVGFAVAPLFHPGPAGPHYGISGLSCGIRSVYPRTLFLFHLLPILLTSIMSACLFSVIYLVLRGTLVIKGGLKLTLDPSERWNGNVQNYQRFVERIARSMLWFPVAYILCLVPYSVTRLMDLSDRVVPFPLLVLAYVFWFMLGVFNVLALYNTFRVLGPAFDGRSTSQKDLESSAGSRTRSSRVMPPMIAAGEHSYQSESMSEVSRPNSMASFNHVLPASMENRAMPTRFLGAQIQNGQERERSASQELERTTSRADSESSNWTVNTVTIPSYYDYGASSTPEIGTAPRPKTQLSQLLLNNAHARTGSSSSASSSVRNLPRQPEPAQSLPAPPRHSANRPSRRPVLPFPQSPHESAVEVRMSAASVNSVDITNWISQQRGDSYMPRGLVSAVGSEHSIPPIPSDAGPGDGAISRTKSAYAHAHAENQKPRRVRGTSSPDPPQF
ncbi:hypothetical protein FB45DRAFT_23934 [Roridomyces roridus]|uniref:G-protein coupled receptors family 1 profile domain-containing protein n=1 Tax=Roridomyces roridus TaxID=1738132 RepID=A0AAD7CME2_9AGAR|nr:hypothetical protein FB45DRAFT_23934 [Roridomyces roridus]